MLVLLLISYLALGCAVAEIGDAYIRDDSVVVGSPRAALIMYVSLMALWWLALLIVGALALLDRLDGETYPWER